MKPFIVAAVYEGECDSIFEFDALPEASAFADGWAEAVRAAGDDGSTAFVLPGDERVMRRTRAWESYQVALREKESVVVEKTEAKS